MPASKQMIEFGAWEPDAAKYMGAAVCQARNVLPAKRGYLPMSTFAELTFSAVPDRVRAAYSFKPTPEEVCTVVATANGIYSLENGVWTSKYSGTSVSEERSIVSYGSSLYCLFGMKLLKADVTGAIVGNFAEVSGAPEGEVLCVVQDFLCIGRLSEYSGGIHWSAIDNPTSWPEVGSDDAQYVQSDQQYFPEGGRVQAIVGGLSNGITGLVFLERGVQLMTYVGSPLIFQFSPVERSRGLVAPRSTVVCGTSCIYLSADGWHITDGSSSRPIGSERVDQWFFSRCNPSRLGDVVGVHDIQRSLAVWAFPSNTAEEGKLDMLLVYNYEVDRWSWGELGCEILFSDYVRGRSLEDLDQYGDISNLPMRSLDDASLMPGRGILGGFSVSHKMGSFNGLSSEAVIDTQEIGGDRFMLHGIRPLVDCGAAESLPIYRSRQQDLQKVGKQSKQGRDGVCYQHLSTVYMQGRCIIPAGSNWSSAVGIEILSEPEGGM